MRHGFQPEPRGGMLFSGHPENKKIFNHLTTLPTHLSTTH